jgi:hypothetical protein
MITTGSPQMPILDPSHRTKILANGTATTANNQQRPKSVAGYFDSPINALKATMVRKIIVVVIVK